MNIGTRVTYDDEDAATTDLRGTVVQPTQDEVAYVATYADPVGPEHGDVLVQWDGEAELGRSWQRPADLQVLP